MCFIFGYAVTSTTGLTVMGAVVADALVILSFTVKVNLQFVVEPVGAYVSALPVPDVAPGQLFAVQV